MKNASPISPLLYRYLIGGIGLVLLILTSLHAASNHWIAWVIAIFIAFQVNASLNNLASEINLSQVIVLEAGLLYGPEMTGWATTAGIVVGYIIRRGRQGDFPISKLFAKAGKNRSSKAEPKIWLAEIGYLLGMNVLPLIIALEASRALQSAGVLSKAVDWLQGTASLPGVQDFAAQIWPDVLAPVFLFALLQIAIFLGDAIWHRSIRDDGFTKDLSTLLLVTLLPLPYITLSVMVNSRLTVKHVIWL